MIDKELVSQNFDLASMKPSQQLIGLMNCFNNSFEALADSFFKELSWRQFFFLDCVALFSDAPSINEMSKTLGCSHQNTKQILLKLEKNGYLKTEKDPQDKRMQRIFLTDKAKSLQNKYSSKIPVQVSKIFDGINDSEINLVTDVISKLIQNIKKGENEK